MKKLNFFLLLAWLPFVAVSQENPDQIKQISHIVSVNPNTGFNFSPPPTERVPVTDNYFGMKVTDNYRWMENLKDPKVLKWLKAQSEYTNSWLDKIPGRDSLIAAFTRLDALAPAEIRNIQRKAGRYFFLKTLPHQKSPKLYYREGKNGKDILLFDPRADGSNGNITLAGYIASEDGKKVAFVVSHGGAEVGKIYTINVNTKKLYPEKIGPTWDGVFGWSKDSKGFIYELLSGSDTKSMSTLTNSKSMYHILGTDLSEDKILLSRKKYPDLGIDSSDACVVQYSEDHQYIFGIPGDVSNDLTIFYAPVAELLNPRIAWKQLAKPQDNISDACFVGDNVYLLTHKDAPMYKIIKISLKHPDLSKAEVVVPEEKDKITNIDRSRDYLFITYSDGINCTAKQYNLRTGKLSQVKLPIVGSGTGFETSILTPYDITSNDGLIGLTSWNQPITRYDYNADTREIKESAFNIKTDYPGINDLKVVETEVRSQDGAMVPLSIIYNKHVKLDGTANCLIDGYGAYGYSMTPFFDPMLLALLNKGVIFAGAHVRGGGEKGEGWHKAGFKTTKPNTWKDFIACAEYLVNHHYTSPQKLAGMGMSAGGITIGRAITERPDLFGAAIDNVGVTNTLRGETMPFGPINRAEFGTVKDSVESRALYEMDALHHVKKGVKYPAVICVGGMHDPRVMLWQPAKFAAKLQWASASDQPVLLDVRYDSGHLTEDKSVVFKIFANMFSFALWQTGNPDFQLKE